MSTSEQLIQSPAGSESLDSKKDSNKQNTNSLLGAAELKPEFADNECPDGDDFANLIDASFNKKDGPIRETDQETIEVDKKTDFLAGVSVTGGLETDTFVSGDLTAEGNVTVSGKLDVSESPLTIGNGETQAQIGEEQLSIGDTLVLDQGEFTVNANTHLNGETRLKGTVSMTHSGELIGPTLYVSGKTEVDQLQVGAPVLLGHDNAHIELRNSGNKDALLVTANGSTFLSLDKNGQLSLGLSGDNSSAKLHIRSDEDDADSVVRVDTKDNDDSPFVITSENNVGVGTESPDNPLDVIGSVRVGASEVVASPHSLSVENRIGVGTASPMARLDIHTQNSETAMLLRSGESSLLDVSSAGVMTDTSLTVAGETGLNNTTVNGTLTVKDETSIAGKTHFEQDVSIAGMLSVEKETYLKTTTISDKTTLEDVLIVEGETKHQGAVGIGIGDGLFNHPEAGLHIRETDNLPGLKIESKEGKTKVLVSENQISLGETGTPVTLNITGDTLQDGELITNTLTVEDHTTLKTATTVESQLTVLQSGAETETDSALKIQSAGENAALEVNHTIGKMLQPLICARVDKVGILNSQPEKALHVSGEARFDAPVELMQSLSIQGPINAGSGLEIQGDAHVSGSFDVSGDTSLGGALSVDGSTAMSGAVAIAGPATLNASLDVTGAATLTSLSANTIQSASTISGASVKAGNDLQVGGGLTIKGFSADAMLGGISASDTQVPTQKAVKTYVDQISPSFGSGGKMHVISTQAEFDNLFNQGTPTKIETNTTILLFPAGTASTTESYMLKNSVRLNPGVSIIGFNRESTRIEKANAGNRFEAFGTSTDPVSAITLDGFTFDGKQIPSEQDGGALYVEYVENCLFNCLFENHIVTGNGGAIYARPGTVNNIEARNIHACQAQNSAGSKGEGGAVYGLLNSVIVAWGCKAEKGGAVAGCDSCQVEAVACYAEQSGGGASQCKQLRLTARACQANSSDGQGGGAYNCEDLICEGIWQDNQASLGPNIYSSEDYFWKGDYVGSRTDPGWKNIDC
ncbi:hypothetical protein [Vibrio quintilis]|uniref:Polymer-forming cytoskeletal n=1 Tax=Vibrio quintilis TaxID=1117707 RepID=A0A1M7YUX3_9VIBR|nr:hypothetical protein [Vibrio quintilis]SHO56459.1 hypothetical protein VQ7734_02228 [Vibrio quintilis]